MRARWAYGLLIADLGLEAACRQSAPLRRGVNTYAGRCGNAQVAAAFGLTCTAPQELAA